MHRMRWIWMNGEQLPWEDATVHVLSHGLHYGTGVFEGIRVYETDSGPAVFRLDAHMERLVHSAQAYRIDLDYDADTLSKAALDLVRANELGHGYIRPIVFLGLGAVGLNPTAAETVAAIACWPWGAYLGEEGKQRGIHVVVSPWRRIGKDAFDTTAKGTGPYINSVMARLDAIDRGADEALLLNSSGEVAEGSGENLFVVKDGSVITPPPEAGILPGITRACVIELLRSDGVEVTEGTVSLDDVHAADELFFTGTAAEVTPIRRVDDTTWDAPGPVTVRMQQVFDDVVSGRVASYRSWLHDV